MKTWNSLSRSGPAAALLLAGVFVLTSGCVGERVTYVQQAPPVVVQDPAPPPPPPEEAPPPPAVELPPAPPPAPAVALRSAAELDTMLGPIALYPDPLLAQILPAATLPEQVVMADRYVSEGGDPNQVDAQPWDASLKALARYPAVLKMLDDNLPWTTDLGQAFLNQPSDVMDAVQRLRAEARAVGNLVSTPQQTVLVNDGVIEIVPATPQFIYVPVYQPEVVYVQPPPAPGRFFISFGVGFHIGAWLNHDCDWHDHHVIVWHHDHPRPVDWWYRPLRERELPPTSRNVTVVNNTTIVNKTVTVWQPRSRDTGAGKGDRGWGQPAVRTPAPARPVAAKPVREVAHPAPVTVAEQRPVGTREVRPTPPAKTPRPTPPAFQRPPMAKPEPLPNAPLQPPKPSPLIASREFQPAPPAHVTTPAPAPPREAAPSKPAPLPPAVHEIVRPNNNPPAPTRVAIATPPPKPAVPTPKDPRPAPAPVAPKPAPVPASHPVASAPARLPSSALTGIESSQATRQASSRGQQSRETVSRPAPAPRPQSAPAPSPKASSASSKAAEKSRRTP